MALSTPAAVRSCASASLRARSSAVLACISSLRTLSASRRCPASSALFA